MDGVFIPCPSLLRSSRGTRSIPFIIFVIILFVVAVVVSIVVVSHTSSKSETPTAPSNPNPVTSPAPSLPESTKWEQYFNSNENAFNETFSSSQ